MKFIRKSFLLLIFISVCSLCPSYSQTKKGPTLNLNSAESFLDSIQAISTDLSSQEKEDFSIALYVLSYGSLYNMENPVGASAFTNPSPTSEEKKTILQNFRTHLKKAHMQGKTAQQIINQANKQLDTSINRYEKGEIRSIKSLSDEAIASLNSIPTLNKIKSSSARIEREKDGSCLFTVTLTNKTDTPISFIEAVLVAQYKKRHFPTLMNLKLSVKEPSLQVKERIEQKIYMPKEYDCSQNEQAKLILKTIVAYDDQNNLLSENKSFASKFRAFEEASQEYESFLKEALSSDEDRFVAKAIYEAALKDRSIKKANKLPVIDGSSKEKYQESLNRLEEGLTENEKKDLSSAIILLAIEDLQSHGEEGNESLRKKLHGKNYKQIIHEADDMMLARMNRAKAQAKKYSFEAYRDAVSALEEGTPELNQIEIISPVWHQNEAGEVVTRAKIKNNSNQTISSLISGVIVETDRGPSIIVFLWELNKPLKAKESLDIETVSSVKDPKEHMLLGFKDKSLPVKPLVVHNEHKLLWANVLFAKHFDTYKEMDKAYTELSEAGSDWKSLFTPENIAKGYFPNDK